jgi:acyl dehydratase
MGLDRDLVGKLYAEKEYKVEKEAMVAYAQATNEYNPKLAGDSPEMASPMFGVVYLLPGLVDVFFDSELMKDANLGRMLHGGQDMRFSRPVRDRDVLKTRTKVESIEDWGTGELLTISFSTESQDGDPVMVGRGTFLFRGPPDPSKVMKKSGPTEIPKVLFEKTYHVDDDQTYRYAEASGDHNPLHVDREMAKAMGFPNVIVQGLCVMALAQQGIIDYGLDGEPARLLRLSVQFSKPVFPGDDLRCIAWEKGVYGEGGRRVLGFIMKSQRGEEVIREGIAELG